MFFTPDGVLVFLTTRDTKGLHEGHYAGCPPLIFINHGGHCAGCTPLKFINHGGTKDTTRDVARCVLCASVVDKKEGIPHSVLCAIPLCPLWLKIIQRKEDVTLSALVPLVVNKF